MDILRWGYEEKGTFTTREAYNIIIKEHIVKDPLWNKVWDPANWPKVSTFLWLLCQNKILTWDNLRKRNYHGPSLCPNCRQEEESTKNLMHSCQLACKLSEKVSFQCQKEGRIQGDIIATIRNWARNPFKSKILNFLSKLIPGFLMWIIWKERNRRIFKDHSSPLDTLWNTICQNIKETLLLQTWHEEDFPSLPQEQNIWANWNLHWNQELIIKGKTPAKSKTPEKWLPPSSHMFQLNFDGASKGNPGKAGFGGIFRDHKGAPLLTFLGSNGWDTNNSIELEGLWQGLLLAQKNGFFSAYYRRRLTDPHKYGQQNYVGNTFKQSEQQLENGESA